MKNLVGIFILAGVIMLGSSFSGAASGVMAGEKADVKAVAVGNMTCPVSGAKVDIDSGMKPVAYEYKGKVYNLCCSGCIGKFAADPEKYSKIAQDEVAAQQTK